MGKTLQQLINDPSTPEDHRRDYQVVLERYKACDKWSVKILNKVGVLLTSHPNNVKFLKASVESHKQLGFWLTLAYDNYAQLWQDQGADIATLPVGTNLQNIHCPELRASMSYDTTTKTTTDIITNIVRDADFNPYVVNDNSYKIKEQELCHELSGNGLRALTDLNIYFSRVATPYVREPVVMPWSLELNFFNDA
jgi:hypothetical protein